MDVQNIQYRTYAISNHLQSCSKSFFFIECLRSTGCNRSTHPQSGVNTSLQKLLAHVLTIRNRRHTWAATVWLRVGNSLVIHAVLNPASARPKAARRPAPPAPLGNTNSGSTIYFNWGNKIEDTNTTMASYSWSKIAYFPWPGAD